MKKRNIKIKKNKNYCKRKKLCYNEINKEIKYVVDIIYKVIDENKQLKAELKFHKKHSLINNGKW